MSIMEQGMQEQMEGAEYHREQEYEQLSNNIEQYIKECGFTWTVKSILDQYRKQNKGHYISHTAKQVIIKFKCRLDLLVRK